MSYLVGNFDDPSKWAKILIGTGSIPSITADIFQATCSAAGDIAGLVTVAPQDLSSCDIRFYADRRTARTALVLRTKQDFANPLPDEVEYLYALIRDEYGYGLKIFDGYGWLYYAVTDPVAPSDLAEMRIVISGGIIHFYYNGIEVWNQVSRIPLESLYIYLLAIATFGVTTTGTTTFRAVPLPLAIDVTPKSASLQVGQSQMFSAMASGGQSPYNIRWIDNATQTEIGIGNTYTFAATLAGNFEIYAVATDSSGQTASTPIIPITVTAPAPKHILTIDSMPITGIPITIEKV